MNEWVKLNDYSHDQHKEWVNYKIKLKLKLTDIKRSNRLSIETQVPDKR